MELENSLLWIVAVPPPVRGNSLLLIDMLEERLNANWVMLRQSLTYHKGLFRTDVRAALQQAENQIRSVC